MLPLTTVPEGTLEADVGSSHGFCSIQGQFPPAAEGRGVQMQSPVKFRVGGINRVTRVHPGGIGKVWYVLVGGFLIPHSSSQVFCAHQEAETPVPKVTQCRRLRLGLRQAPPVHTLLTSILRGPGLLGVARNHGAWWLLLLGYHAYLWYNSGRDQRQGRTLSV